MKTIKTKLSLFIITVALQCNESGRIFNFPRQMVSMSVSAPLSIRTPHAMKDAHLYHSDAGFSVYSEGEMKLIHSSDMDLMARRLKKDNIVAFIERGGKIHLSPMSDGSVMMRTTIGGQGGGWLAANIMYYGTYATGVMIPVAMTYMLMRAKFSRDAAAQYYGYSSERLFQASKLEQEELAKKARKKAESSEIDLQFPPIDLQFPPLDSQSGVQIIARSSMGGIKDSLRDVNMTSSLWYGACKLNDEVSPIYGVAVGIAAMGVAGVKILGRERSERWLRVYWDKVGQIADRAYAVGQAYERF